MFVKLQYALISTKMNSIKIQSEIQSSISPLDAIPIFKIFGQESFTFQKAADASVVDWSGFYTQLSPQHSLRYLTKKWNDGATEGCLVQLLPINKHLRIITIRHPCLGQATISGESKGLLIKQHLQLKYMQFQEIANKLLIEQVGKRLMVMRCMDSEEQEIIIPPGILNQHNFDFKHLMHFKRSNDGFLRTICYRFANNVGWNKTCNQYQFEPHLMLKQQSIAKQLNKILIHQKQQK